MNETVNNAGDTVAGWLSALPFGEQLGPIIVVLAILIIGLLLARIIRAVVHKGLKRVPWLYRRGDDDRLVDLATPIAKMVYYLIVLFVLIAVLERMGMNNVLDPLKKMVSDLVGYLPKILGAGIVAYVGYMLASIISEFVGMALGKFDQQLAMRTGRSELRTATVGRTFVFAAILLPIIVAALGVLDIEAISAPATAMIQKFMTAIPNIIAAMIIIGLTWFVARFLVQILTSLLDGLQLDTWTARLGVSSLFGERFTPTAMIGGVVMFFAMLAGVTAAVDRLDIAVISELMARLLEFAGGIVVGGVILIVGNFLATLAHDHLKGGSNPALAGIARIAILGLVLAMGLKAMGLADNIVNMAFGFTLGSVAVAAALAFGLGGRDAAKTVSDRWANKL